MNWEFPYDSFVYTHRQPLGRVRRIHTERSAYLLEASTRREGPRRPEETIVFDELQRIVEFAYYDRQTLRGKHSNRLDEDGRILESRLTNHDGSLDSYATYTYGSASKPRSRVEYRSDGAILRTTEYTYDSEGDLTETRGYYADRTLMYHLTKSLNCEGMITEMSVFYDRDGLLTSKLVDVDDRQRRLKERCSYDAGGLLQYKWASSYNPNRSETQRVVYGPEGVLERTYNFSFDDFENMIEQTEYSAEGEMKEERVIRFEFDPVGNWIKQEISVRVPGSEPVSYWRALAIYRTITYWPDDRH